MEQLNYSEILVRAPFYEILPTGYKKNKIVYRGMTVKEKEDRVRMRILTQADFLRMYYPSGHRIMDPEQFPDIYKQDPDTKRWYIQPVSRTAFAFQQVIAIKQIVHLTGNDIQFELSGRVGTKEEELSKQKCFLDFRQGWLDMKMEYAFYQAVKAIKVVGDAAVLGYFDKDGKPQTKTMSYLQGDTLYPHFDSITGELVLFARKYYDLDDDGRTNTEYVEVWDDKYFYRAKRGIAKNGFVQKIKEVFGLSGYKLIEEPKPHGFNFCPIAYHREEDGPCYLPSQTSIENYEEAVAYFCENNKAYAFPIMYSKGDGVEFKPDSVTGAVKFVEMTDTDSDAGFLNKPDVSTAFNTQLKILYDMIYEQAFAVKPPELKSGDLPGVAVKLLFSPAIEKGICDAQNLHPFLEKLIKIVTFAYGFYSNQQSAMMLLQMNAWIEPYIHQNDTELMTNLATGVQNKFISKQTASERASKYTKNDELDRIMQEDLDERAKDLKDKIAMAKQETEEKIKQIKAQKEGQDVNTGGGGTAGRPNRSGRTYDDNGNWPGRNNWKR